MINVSCRLGSMWHVITLSCLSFLWRMQCGQCVVSEVCRVRPWSVCRILSWSLCHPLVVTVSWYMVNVSSIGHSRMCQCGMVSVQGMSFDVVASVSCHAMVSLKYHVVVSESF